MPSEALAAKNALLAYLDAYAQELLNQTQEHAMLGRMSAPWKIDGASFDEGRLAPRFADPRRFEASTI